MAVKVARKNSATSTLMVRLDGASKAALVKAAQLRRVSVSDYVRQTSVPQAQKEIDEAETGVIRLSPENQLKLWKLINAPVKLTASQKRLGRIMRGEE